MTRFKLLLLLVLPVLANAQPIDGPYLVLAAGEGAQFKSPHIVFREPNLAGIFYVLVQAGNDEVQSASFSLASHELISGPGLPYFEEGWRQNVTDVENQLDESWAAVIYSENGCCSAVTAVIGTQDDTAATLLESADCSGEYFRSWILPQGLNKRPCGGWVLAWTRMECGWPFYEHTFFPQIGFFRGTNPEDTVEVYSESCLFGPSAATTMSLSADTALILLSGDENFPWLDGSVLRLVSRTGPTYPCDPWEGEAMLSCTWSNLDFQMTHGGRLLVFSGIGDPYYPQYPHPRIVEVDTNGNCTELATLELDRDPDAIAWRPDWGFAALLVHPARIMLARVDTNGAEVQPLGIFWEPEGGNRIEAAELAIANDGRVIVLWCELDAAEVSRLKIGSVEWDTFLGVEEELAVPLPETISISAHPNPFNLSTTISFSLSRTMQASVTIHDITGRRVRQLANAVYESGNHRLRFDSEGLPSGIYFVQLRTRSFSKAMRLLLIK